MNPDQEHLVSGYEEAEGHQRTPLGANCNRNQNRSYLVIETTVSNSYVVATKIGT